MSKTSLHPYETTADEVLSQYDLSDKQKEEIKAIVASTGCPWFSIHVYARTHHAAAVYLAERIDP